jgi:hypothetical protein
MGLEVATFVDDFVTTNPLGGDIKGQGDDHLRLVKSVLQSTFPNASRAYRFPVTLAKAVDYTVLATDENTLILVDASGGALTITLPDPTAMVTGFAIKIKKIDLSTNAVTITQSAAETIDGGKSFVLDDQNAWVELLTDKVNWFVIAWGGDQVLPISSAPGAISNGADAEHDIDIAPGTWRAQDRAVNIRLDATTIAIDSTGNGGRLDGETLDADGTYHVLSGRDTTTGAFVAGFKKTDALPSVGATAWDFYRRHGLVWLDSSSNIKAFIQDGDRFYLETRFDFSDLTPGAAGVLQQVGPAFELELDCILHLQEPQLFRMTVQDPALPDVAPTNANMDIWVDVTGDTASVGKRIRCNSSGEVRYRADLGAAVNLFRIGTFGWTDPRGRHG